MKNYENLVDEHLEFMIRLACEAQEDAEIDELIAESQCEHTPEEKEIIRKQYFPDRLTDRYKEEGYFDFHASAFLAKGKTAWTASSCARILSAIRQCSITSCCTSWRMFLRPQ